MELDERKIGGVENDGFKIENQERVESNEATETLSTPDFGLPTELGDSEDVKQVEALNSESITESPIEVDSGSAHEVISSAQKSREAEVLESLINHGVPLENASDEMEQVLALSADLKE